MIGVGLLVKIYFLNLNRTLYHNPASKKITVSRETIKYDVQNDMISISCVRKLKNIRVNCSY
jgi:hypothetical protein